MTTVEAAASLFESGDGQSDPFASITTLEASTSSSDDVSPTGNASHIPDTGMEHPLYIPESTMETPYDVWSQSATPTFANSRGTDLNSAGSSYDQLQGWNDGNGHWQHFEQPSTQWNAQVRPQLLSQSHQEHYVSTASKPMQHSINEQHPISAADPAYNPYATPGQSVLNYNPATTNTYSQSTYDPYKPPSSTFRSVTSEANHPYTYAPTQAHAPVAPVAPPPPAPMVTINRPKTANAYDPPLLPTKSRRGPPPRHEYTTPLAGQQARSVSAYDRYSSPTALQDTTQLAHKPQTNIALGHSMSAAPPPMPHQVPFHLAFNPAGDHGRAGMSIASNDGVAATRSGAKKVDTSVDGGMGQVHPNSDLRPSFRPTVADVHPHLPQQPLEANHWSSVKGLEHSPVSAPQVGTVMSSPPCGQAPPENVHQSVKEATDLMEHNPLSPEDHSFATSSPHQTYPLEASSSQITNAAAPFPPPLPPGPNQAEHSLLPGNGMELIPKPYDPPRARSLSPASTSSLHSNGSLDPYSRGITRSPVPRASSADLSSLKRGQSPELANASAISFSHSPTAPSSVNGKRHTDAYAPATTASGLRYPKRVSSLMSLQPRQSAAADPYAPSSVDVHNYSFDGAASLPSSMSSSIIQPSHDPYAPPPKGNSTGATAGIRDRSMSNTSLRSVESVHATHQRGPETGETPDYGAYVPRHDFGQAPDARMPKAAMSISGHQTQDTLLPAPTHAPYAPSPSLHGLNDPLGRHLTRVPLISFGGGGKMVVCFHRPSDLSTGFDVALSSRICTEVQIRALNQVIPEFVFYASAASFPGPLFMDASTSGLVRTGVAAQLKSKKTSVIKYLDERADELSRAIGYLHMGSTDQRGAEGKLVLVRLLKIMVEHDGQLSGSSAIDASVRAALLPHLDFTSSSQDTSLVTPALAIAGYSNPDLHHPIGDMSTAHLSSTDAYDAPIAVSTLRPSALDKIQDFLLRGDRRKAYHFALDQKLWAHAMIIAGSIDKDAWKEVATEFLKTELGIRQGLTSKPVPDTSNISRAPLRVAYSLYSGQGAAAVSELSPSNSLPTPSHSLQVSSQRHPTPLSPNFPPIVTTYVSPESLAKWPETAAMMLSSPLTPDASTALTALGDCLLFNQWTEAAHACFLLGPQTSPIGGVGNPSARIVLLGTKSPQITPYFYRDPDPVLFTEILEFALSLSPNPKGQDPFQGLPHLQAYKLLRAASLLELGHVRLANRYCEAVAASLGRPSPYFTSTFVEQLHCLSDRILGCQNSDKSGSWTAKMTKPSLDSIGTWLEGRFTKLITGDGDSPTSPADETVQREQNAFSGPFSHYSEISSSNSSNVPSPRSSMINLNALPPRRSGSAMSVPSASINHHIDRANSAMDHLRHRPSPGPRVVSANAAVSNFAQSLSFGQAVNGYVPGTSSYSEESIDTVTPTLDKAQNANDVQPPAWWSSPFNTSSANVTPVATAFVPSEGSPQSSTDSWTQETAGRDSLTQRTSDQMHHDLEDLGLGNSKPKSKVANGQVENPPPEAEKKSPKDARTPEAGATSWFSRWWKKSDNQKAIPIKANLGDERSFYYDKELKRWVNKTAGSEPEKPAAIPPPPSRVQTASPGRSKPPRSSSPVPIQPPLRSASAIDLSILPPTKPPPRMRSNLAPPSEAESESPTASSQEAGPPPGRPKSQASKRNVRYRYVDVLQQGS